MIQREWGEAHRRGEKQMGGRLDDGLVLLQGSDACLLVGRKERTCFTLALECIGVFYEASSELPRHGHGGCGLR
jgi:hypothetical protein